MDAPRIDVEWEAFSRGAKPAIRRTVDPAQADALEARWRREGFAVSRAKCLSPMGGREVAVLYLARSAALADALRDAEEPVLQGSPRYVPGGGPSVVAQHRAVGEALGFPACCVEAFCARLARGVDVLGAHRNLSEDYVAAREAWVARPDPRLNPLLVRARVQVVSFYPCRFDCPAARACADATLAAVATRHGDAAVRALVAALSRAVLIAPTGARCVATVRESIVTETSTVTDDPRDMSLAESLRGASIDAQWLVVGTGDPPVCGVRFDVGVAR
jgi:hypothetical protein